MLGVRGFGFWVFEARCFEVPGLGLVFRGSGLRVVCLGRRFRGLGLRVSGFSGTRCAVFWFSR